MSDPEVAELLAAVAGDRREELDRSAWKLSEVTVGERAVLVEATTPAGEPAAGLAHRPREGTDASESESTFADATVSDLLALCTAPAGTDDRAVGVATLNAVSAPALSERVRPGDPMALLDADVDLVATVGLFRPAFRKFRDVTVRVIERDPVDPASVDAPEGVRVETAGTDDLRGALADADVVFLTGSAFVYGGADRALAAAPAHATVVVVGASASFSPERLFAAGVDVVAGARVTDPASARAAVAAGACGTDLHDAGVEKVYLAHGGAPGLALAGEAESVERADERTRNRRTWSRDLP